MATATMDISHLSSMTMTPTAVSADAAIIANQAVDIMQLQNKLQLLGHIEQSFAQQKQILDDSMKSKQATQEIFFKASMENKELQQSNQYLQHALNEKDSLLIEYKQDSHLEQESLQKLHAFQIRKMSGRFQTVKLKNECLMQAMQAKQCVDTDLCDMKYDALLAKYQYLSTEHKAVCTQLSLCHTQLAMAEHENAYLSLCESALASVAHRLQSTSKAYQSCTTRVARKQHCVQQLSAENAQIRGLHHKLTRIICEQDNKLAHLISQNNKLNTIIEHHDQQSEKMQHNFQRDLATKAAVIAKLESKMDAFQNDSHLHQNANDSLKQQHNALQEQIATLKHDKIVAQKEMEHLRERLTSKDAYVDTLKQQIATLNENMNRLHDENAAMQSTHETMEQRLKHTANESDTNYKSLTEKHKTLQSKTKQLASKLQQIYEDKKTLKRQVIELKQACQHSAHAQQTSERDSEQQCDAMQASIEKLKSKIVQKNETMQKLQNTLHEAENVQIEQNQQIAVLQQENESLKFLIQTLEVDQKQLHRQVHTHGAYRKKTHDVVQRIVSENEQSTHMNQQVLDAIAEDDRYDTTPIQVAGEEEEVHHHEHDEEEEEDEDADQDSDLERSTQQRQQQQAAAAAGEEEDDENEDLDIQPSSAATTRNSNKRRRSVELDADDNNQQPPKKRARVERTKNQSSRTDDTPFKGGKEIYSQRQRKKNKSKDKNKNKNNRLPKPRLK